MIKKSRTKEEGLPRHPQPTEIHCCYREREIKVQYQRLARFYHPDKYDPTTNKMSKSEAQVHFKLINNVYKYLRT